MSILESVPKHLVTSQLFTFWASQVAVQVIKNPPANAGDVRDEGSIPASGRSLE